MNELTGISATTADTDIYQVLDQRKTVAGGDEEVPISTETSVLSAEPPQGQALTNMSDPEDLQRLCQSILAMTPHRTVEGRTQQKLRRRAKEKNRRATVAAQRRKKK